MEGKSILPANLNDIQKFKSETSNWVLEHQFVLLFILQKDAPQITLSSDNSKIASKTKPCSARQNLNWSIFTNMQHLHPALQFFVLKRLLNFYSSKKELTDGISFYHCMSVSVSLTLYHFTVYSSKQTPFLFCSFAATTYIYSLCVLGFRNLRFD